MPDLIGFADTYPLLDRTNRDVNRRVKWVSDLDRVGLVDRWRVLRDLAAGDCEDYALTKRHLLIEQGLPPAALLLAMGWLANDARHAVLLVDSHDYGLQVLDSLTDHILPWNDCLVVRWHGYSVPGEHEWRKLQPA